MKLHLNPPQLRSLLVGAPNEVLIAGRGTGKSEGIIAPKTAKQYFGTMPRGTGVFLGRTYKQILTRTLPATIYGWEKLGYIKDVHFLVGRKPPEKWLRQWNWRGPFRPPLEYTHFISWWNGSGAHLVSQDGVGLANGATVDWIVGDEAKLLDHDKFTGELVPANRGFIPEFKENPNHHGITFTTDMPVGTAGQWLFDYEKAMNRESLNRIWQIQVLKYQLNYFLQKEKPSLQKDLKKTVTALDEELTQLRIGLMYYHTASTIDNIHALGINYIKQQLRDTTTFQFDTQILNIRPLKLEDGFYPDFNEEVHGYFAKENNDKLIGLDFDFDKLLSLDCRYDTDLNPTGSLHIAIDYNRRLYPLVVGQVFPDEIRIVKGMHVEYPNKLDDVLTAFIDYYKYHKKKVVYYWYDHTAVAEDRDTTRYEDVVSRLTLAGWTVIPRYTGLAPGHGVKYEMWGHLLRNTGKYDKRFIINRENCPELIVSIYKTGVEKRKDGFGKDKKSEHDEKFPAVQSTHYSDTLDMLAHGILESGLDYEYAEEPVDTIAL